jgi:hypothetical protein
MVGGCCTNSALRPTRRRAFGTGMWCPCFRSAPVVIVPLLRVDTTISHLCKVPYRPERLQISHRNETLSSGAPLTSAMLGSNASHSGLPDVLCDFQGMPMILCTYPPDECPRLRRPPNLGWSIRQTGGMQCSHEVDYQGGSREAVSYPEYLSAQSTDITALNYCIDENKQVAAEAPSSQAYFNCNERIALRYARSNPGPYRMNQIIH